VVANIITNEVNAKDIPSLDDEEESKVLNTTYSKNTMTNSEEEYKTTKSIAQRSQMGSNNVNNTPK
jgi:hypothetical protein